MLTCSWQVTTSVENKTTYDTLALGRSRNQMLNILHWECVIETVWLYVCLRGGT